MGSIDNLGVMGTLSFLDNMATPCRPEGLDGKVFPLLHFSLVVVFDQLDGFTTMDLVLVDRMTTQVCDRFHWQLVSNFKSQSIFGAHQVGSFP